MPVISIEPGRVFESDTPIGTLVVEVCVNGVSGFVRLYNNPLEPYGHTSEYYMCPKLRTYLMVVLSPRRFAEVARTTLSDCIAAADLAGY